jgi:hypothetical protein
MKIKERRRKKWKSVTGAVGKMSHLVIQMMDVLISRMIVVFTTTSTNNNSTTPRSSRSSSSRPSSSRDSSSYFNFFDSSNHGMNISRDSYDNYSLNFASSSNNNNNSCNNCCNKSKKKRRIHCYIISSFISLFLLWSMFVYSITMMESHESIHSTGTDTGSDNQNNNMDNLINLKDFLNNHHPNTKNPQQQQTEEDYNLQKLHQEKDEIIISPSASSSTTTGDKNNHSNNSSAVRSSSSSHSSSEKNDINNHHLPNLSQHDTGAFANCTKSISSSTSSSSSQQKNIFPDQRSTIVSCHTINYRIKKKHLLQMKLQNHNQNHNSIVIGVLSSGKDDKNNNNNGFQRRQSIRDTWAYNQTGIFFLVAKPFHSTLSPSSLSSSSNKNDNINNTTMTTQHIHNHNSSSLLLEEEYELYDDLVWIDEEENYNGEQSVLTYKTLSFVNIIHDLVLEIQQEQEEEIQHEYEIQEQQSFVKYIFKTDDDSYLHIQNLYLHLFQEESTKSSTTDNQKSIDYWGECKKEQVEPLRSNDNKWAVSYELYPEQFYPKYCQGAGFALSWKLIDCASSSSSLSSKGIGSSSSSSMDSHIANARYMPFEDVAVGLIAKRCNFEPTNIQNKAWMHMYRFERAEEKWRVNKGLERMPKFKLPKPNMDGGRVIQHRIYDDWDMREHHKIVMDKERYDEESEVQWYYRPEEPNENE